MGLCALCCAGQDQTVPRGGPTTAESKKQRHLLMDMERTFQLAAGEDQMMTKDELVNLWVTCSRKHKGKLTDEEVAVIQSTGEELFKSIDTDDSGKVSYHEFLGFSLRSLDGGEGALKSLRQKMNQQLAANPDQLENLVKRFQMWDKNGDGFVTIEELDSHLQELTSMAGGNMKEIAFMQKVKDELFKVADVDNDGKIDIWEAIAWMLGRRKQPVELLLYDISKGATEWLGPLLLARTDIEAFHSAVLTFGSEFWYGGKVFRTDPPCEKQFGPPLRHSAKLAMAPSQVRPDLHVVHMGYTFVTQEEYVRFLQEKVVERYTGLQKYDLLTHSCNHFSDESLHFLLGRGVPDHVLELQRMALTPTVRALRPFLNRYLGGFSQEAGGGDVLENDVEVLASQSAADLVGEGSLVMVDAHALSPELEGPTIAAALVHEKGNVCDLKYVDPKTHHIVHKTGVPMSAVKSKVGSFLDFPS